MNRRETLRGRRHNRDSSSSTGFTKNIILIFFVIALIGLSAFLFQENKSIEAKLSSIQTSNNLLKNQIRELREEVSDQSMTMNGLRSDKDLFEEEWTNGLIRNSELEKENRRLRNLIKDDPLRKSSDVLDLDTIRELESEIKILEDDLKKKEDEIRNLKAENSSKNDAINCKVTRAKVIRRPAPIYPKRALDRDIEGTVKLSLGVSTSGRPIDIRVLSTPSDILSNAAMSAARKISFSPSKDCYGNSIIDQNLTISYSFKMDK